MNAVAVPRGTVFTLQSHEIEAHWALLLPHLERVERDFPDEINVPAFLADLVSARKQLWGYHDGEHVTGLCVTEIQHPVCWLRAGVGTESWRGQIEEIIASVEAWARSIGCERIKLVGRVGWKRRLPSFHQTGVVLEKPL